jgi:transposase-like protein
LAIRDEVLKELLEGYKKPEDLLGPEGLLKKLTAALVEKALSAEMAEHLGYEKHEVSGARLRQLAQRDEREDLEDRVWRDADRGAAGPEREFRAAAGQEAPDAF